VPKRNRKKLPPGVIQKNIQIKKTLDDRMKKVQQLREPNNGGLPRQWALWTEAIELFLSLIDMETGMVKPIYHSAHGKPDILILEAKYPPQE
jgi:hypothetical protein